MDAKVKETTGSQSPNTGGKKSGSNILTFLISLMPWTIVGILLWAGIFVKPTGVIDEVIPPVIDVRDNIFGLSIVTSGTYLAAGNYGKILISTDKGRTWENQKTPTESHLQDITSWDENRSAAVGNAGVTLMTEDGGKTWVEVESPRSETANKLLRVHSYPNGEGWAVGEMGMILNSQDYGKTWTKMREEEDVFMNDIVRADENTLFIAGEFGLIFKSDDNGQTWKDTQTDSPNSFTAVAFRTPMEGVVVGLGGAIVTTQDGGETWSYIDPEKSGMTEHLMDVDWSEETNQWVAIGNKGKWIKFPADLSTFNSRNLSATDLTSHTEMALDGDHLLAVGATVGSLNLKTDIWTLFSN